MMAVIPLVVWAIGLLLAGGGLGAGGTYAVIKWNETRIAPAREGVFSDPMQCVHEYYMAVCSANHRQYQYCVLEPLDKQAFEKNAVARKEKREESGIDICQVPVRGRSHILEKGGHKYAYVYAVSPLTGKEETYLVVEHGKSWRIVEEK